MGTPNRTREPQACYCRYTKGMRTPATVVLSNSCHLFFWDPKRLLIYSHLEEYDLGMNENIFLVEPIFYLLPDGCTTDC